MKIIYTEKDLEKFRKWGSEGGKKTVQKHGKKLMSRIGKIGGKAANVKRVRDALGRFKPVRRYKVSPSSLKLK